MKKLILAVVLAAGASLTAMADSYNYLNIIGATTQSVARTTIKKITFDGTNAIVTTTAGTTVTTPLATLTQLSFSDTALGVGSVEEQRPISFQNGCIVASGRGTLKLYNAGGQLMRQLTVGGERGELNLSDLPHGIYIVRFGHQSLKFIY